jgi:hypothetical protein
MNKLAVLVLCLGVLAAGCGGNPQLSWGMLVNMEYTDVHIPSGKAQLVNGVYRFTDQQSRRTYSVVIGDWWALDDFSGDGLEDAAVLLITDAGDEIRLYDLAIVANENGIPIEAANIYLGGEIRVEKFCAQNGKLYITVQYPGSPQEQELVYGLEAGIIQAK